MLYLTCTAITSVDHAHYGVSSAKDLGICGLRYNSSLTNTADPNGTAPSLSMVGIIDRSIG